MWQNIIGKHIARVSRNLFITSLLVLLCVVGLGALGYRFLSNVVRGPAPISAQSLEAIKDPDAVARYYVTVHGDAAPIDTGVTEIEQEKDKYTGDVKGEHTTAGLVALPVGKHLLLVKESNQPNSTTFNGTLTDIPADIREKTITEIEADPRAVKGMFLPFMLDASESTQLDFTLWGWVGLAIGVIVAAWCVRDILLARHRDSNPASHPVAKRLAAYGEPYQVADEIDSDFRQGATKYDKITLTRSWLLNTGAYRLDVMHLNEVVWAYMKTTQHYHSFIPTGKTFSAIINDRNGRQVSVQMSKRSIEAVLGELATRVPWAIYGFSQDVKRSWTRNRGEVIAVVAERERAARQPQAPPSAGAPPSYV